MSFKDNLKDYENVKTRKKKFYEKYPDGRIILDCVKADENMAMFKCYLYISPEDQTNGIPLATGHAMEQKGQGGMANKHAWVENCEESAVGRATDNAGFATRCSKEEMIKVGVAEGSVTLKQLKDLGELIEVKGWPREKVRELCLEMFGVEDARELTNDSYTKLYKHLQVSSFS